MSRNDAALTLFLLLVLAGLGWYGIAHVPASARVAIHFGLNGRPNGFASPPSAFSMLPALGLGLWVLFLALPHLDRSEQLTRAGRSLGLIAAATMLILVVAQGVILAHALGGRFSVMRVAALSLGGFWMVLGNLLGKFGQNRFVGIRTRWTLADRRVWDRTHRMAGFVFAGGGLILALCGLLIRAPVPLSLVLAGVPLATIIVPAVWSRRYAEA